MGGLFYVKPRLCIYKSKFGFDYKKTAQLAGLNLYMLFETTRGAMPQGTTPGQIGAGTWFPSEYAGAGFGQCPSVPDGNALRCIAMRIGSIPRFLD